MACFSILLVFILLRTHLKRITARENVTVNIAVFYDASDRYIQNVLQNAENMFITGRREKNPRNVKFNLHITLRWVDEAEFARSQIGLNHSLFDRWNISSPIHGAIFVDINGNSLFVSSILERSGIPTVGIFQTREQPRTQVGLMV